MKKVLIVLLIFLIVAGIGLAYFLSHFDADRYRPLIAGKLESAIGSPVRLDHISLTWAGGIALDLKGLAILSRQHPEAEPALELEEASALIRLLPLLRREFQIGTITLKRPQVHLSQDPEGKFRVAGIEPPSRKAGRGRETALGTLPFFIDAVKIERGLIHYTDNTQHPPAHLNVQNLDLSLQNVSLIQPIEVKAKFDLFSDHQNLDLSGRFKLPMPRAGSGSLEKVRLKTDLGDLNVAQAADSIPLLRSTGLEKLGGKLLVEIESLKLDKNGVSSAEAHARLSDGLASLEKFPGGVQDLQFEAVARATRLQVIQISARLAEGSVAATGALENFKNPLISFDVKMNHLALEKLLPPPQIPTDPELHGDFSATLQGTAQGKSAQEISQTLSGQARLLLKNGVVRNLNVLQEVFGRLSVLPGLVANLQRRLPPSYQAKFEEPDTAFGPIDLPVAMERGMFTFENLNLATDTFELNGKGSARAEGPLMAQAVIRIDPDLSAAIVGIVNELRYLADSQGRLEIPVRIQGTFQRPLILPDLPYVASRLAVTKTEEFLGGLLRPKGTVPETAPPSSQGTPQTPPAQKQKPPKFSDILGGLLQQGLQKKNPSERETASS